MINYLVPQSAGAKFAVGLLVLIAAVWCFWLYQQLRAVGFARVSMLRLNEVLPRLRAYRLSLERARAEGHTAGQEAGPVFNRELESLGLLRSDPIPAHLYSIFNAGVTESRLEVPELIRHTERRLASRDAGLRMFLNLFVIVGLLGTLLGLASSLGGLQGSGDPAALQQSVHNLLGNLGTAFVSALWGVLFSFLAAVSYSFAHNLVIAPALADIRETTLDWWVPELVPTVGQLAAEAAQKSLKAAVEVSDFAKSIHTEADELRNSVRESAVAAKAFALGMHRFNKALGTSDEIVQSSISSLAAGIDKFSGAISRWSSFENEIRQFYSAVAVTQAQQNATIANISELLKEHQLSMKEMKDKWTEDTKASQAQFGRAMFMLDQTVRKVPERFDAVAVRAESLIDSLHSSVGKIGADLSTALYVQTQETKDQHARLLADAHGRVDQLLSRHIADIKVVVEVLKSFYERLSNLREPFENSANRLIDLATNFRRNAESNLGELGTRLDKQTLSFENLVKEVGAGGTNMQFPDAISRQLAQEIEILSKMSQAVIRMESQQTNGQVNWSKAADVLARLDYNGQSLMAYLKNSNGTNIHLGEGLVEGVTAYRSQDARPGSGSVLVEETNRDSLVTL